MKTVDMVCLGDSIVYGYGTYPTKAWPFLVSQRLGIQILNKGENGDTTDGMRARFTEDVLWNRPEKVFIMGGANDILMGISKERTQESIRWMVEKAKAQGIFVILGIPLQIDGELLKGCWFSFYSIEDTMAAFRNYREWLLAYAKENQVCVVDFQKEFPERLEKLGILRGFQDGVHPTGEGYGVMADIFCDAYREICGEQG